MRGFISPAQIFLVDKCWMVTSRNVQRDVLDNQAAEEAIIMETQYEDCTPTWEETAHLLVHTLQCNPDNESARAELLRMGKIIDQQQAYIKQSKEVA